MVNNINIIKYLYYLLLFLCIVSTLNNLYQSPYRNPYESYDKNPITLKAKYLEQFNKTLSPENETTFITSGGIPLSPLDFGNLSNYYQSQFVLVPFVLTSDQIVSDKILADFKNTPPENFLKQYGLKIQHDFDNEFYLLTRSD